MATKSLTWTAGWSYNAEGNYVKIAEYSSGSKKEKISSIVILLGTGNATYTTGSHLTGNGSAITTYVSIGDSYTSDAVTVTNKVGQSSYSGGTYPTKSDLVEYTFSFSSGVEVSANTTVSIYVRTPATPSGGTGQVLCMGESGYATYTEIDDVQYTLTFNANGGSVKPTSYTKPSGTVVTLPTPSKSYVLTFDKNGGDSVYPESSSRPCSFNNWNTNSDGSGTSYSAGANYIITKNTTLYAIWTNPSAGDLPIATRQNCRFHMWTTTRNGSTQVTSSTIITSNTTIYAKWKYYITYKMNGGSIDGDDSNNSYSSSTSGTSDIVELKTHGVNYTIGSYYPEKSGSTFYGWSSSPTATSPSYVDGDTYSTNEPLILYAVYNTQTFTVKFTDGYSGTILKSQKVNYGQNATPPPNPTRKGYEFQGWIGNYTNVKANLTIKAYWGFTPVWIMTSSGWKKYEPKE